MSGTDSALALDAGLETVLELVESVVGEAFGLADRIGAETAAVFTRKPSVRRADLGGVLELAQPVLEDPDARIQERASSQRSTRWPTPGGGSSGSCSATARPNA